MNRLKVYFLELDKNNTTYETIYAGAYGYDKSGKIFYVTNLKDVRAVNAISNPTYLKDDISYTITRTHKFSLSKPCITISIPFNKLDIPASNHRVAEADFFLRFFNKYIAELNAEIDNNKRTDKENGKFYSYVPNNEIIERNMCFITGNIDLGLVINIMITVQLPENNHKKAMQMVCVSLPEAVNRFIQNFDKYEYNKAIEFYDMQTQIRKWLETSDYCAFIANGSILPRKADSVTAEHNAIPFISPKEDEIEVFGIKGMGIKKGVTVITGGGYSGKTTILNAISSGIYYHVFGDGRELVFTDSSAMKISAEDGRSVKNINLSPFIRWLPKGNTSNFTSDRASGSTSQAANIMEAINYGAKLLLIDEDNSATNFMIRDKMMKTLINKEPLTPFTERVNQIYSDIDVSSIIVIGGSGEYLAVAEKVLMADDFYLYNVTDRAKDICRQFNHIPPISEDTGKTNWFFSRKLNSENFSSYPQYDNNWSKGSERLEISDNGCIKIGDETIDVRMLHNVVSNAQINAIGQMIRYLEISKKDEFIDIKEKIDELFLNINSNGFGLIHTTYFNCDSWLELPRKYELLAAIDRMKHLEWTNE